MSYGLQYRCEYSNDLNQTVLILLAQKDVPALPDPMPFEIIDQGGLQLNDDTEEQTIIAREAVIIINADDATPITWETFLTGAYDEWWVIIYVDNNCVFEGFLTPEEGSAAFLDKPYEVTLRATNGLKLLQKVPLVKIDGTAFKGKFTLIEYIAAALHRTLLNGISSNNGIPIRIYSNVLEATMIKRSVDITKDFYQQVKLDHRTFQSDPTTFKSCYEALVIILGRHSRLFYWNARWVISWNGDHQETPGGRFYTEYNADGTVIQGVEDPENYATVGKTALIYPINEDQQISSNFALKLARTNFMLDIWKEIPLNNKFERGTFFDEGPMQDIYDQDGDGNVTEIVGTFKRFTIDDWFYGLNTGPTSNLNLPVLNPTAAKAYRRSIYNQFGIELTREVQLNVTGDAFSSEKWLQSEGIPVRTGDKIKVDFNFRTTTDISSGTGNTVNTTVNTVRIYIKAPGSTNKVSLRWDANMTSGKWETTNGSSVQRAIIVNYTGADDTSKYTSVSVESLPIPFSGDLYIILGASVNNQTVYYSGFNLTYTPYVAGGYLPVEGDYVQHSQSANNQDTDTEDIKISDSLVQVANGAMLTAAGIPTNPTWARGNLVESLQFKTIVNLVRFNFGWRRFWEILGSFTSFDFEPENDQLNKQPLGYHKNFRFIDITDPREFILRPPLRIDVNTGNIQAEFQEVLRPSQTETSAGVITIKAIRQAIIDAINATTPSEWDSAGLAPGPGTPHFPPLAYYADNPLFDRVIFIRTNPGGVVTSSASPGTAGNTPSLTKDGEPVTDGYRTTLLLLGTSIAVGNIFNVTIFGHTVSYEIKNLTRPVDGSRTGTFTQNYIFGNG